MAESLPYLAAPGSLKTCLQKISAAATPERITRDFVTTKLGIKGGTGAALIPYLKKIGFVASDGSPTQTYKQFRNSSTAGLAAANAIRHGYAPLKAINEYFFELTDNALLALIVQVTGVEQGSQTAKLTLSTMKVLKAIAKFDGQILESAPKEVSMQNSSEKPSSAQSIDQNTINHAVRKLNLSYTINLNLPATSDQSVFNAIFKSLKDHLLSDQDD